MTKYILELKVWIYLCLICKSLGYVYQIWFGNCGNFVKLAIFYAIFIALLKNATKSLNWGSWLIRGQICLTWERCIPFSTIKKTHRFKIILQPLPFSCRPLYCTSMMNLVLCFTGFRKKEELVSISKCSKLALFDNEFWFYFQSFGGEIMSIPLSNLWRNILKSLVQKLNYFV